MTRGGFLEFAKVANAQGWRSDTPIRSFGVDVDVDIWTQKVMKNITSISGG